MVILLMEVQSMLPGMRMWLSGAAASVKTVHVIQHRAIMTVRPSILLQEGLWISQMVRSAVTWEIPL